MVDWLWEGDFRWENRWCYLGQHVRSWDFHGSPLVRGWGYSVSSVSVHTATHFARIRYASLACIPHANPNNLSKLRGEYHIEAL